MSTTIEWTDETWSSIDNWTSQHPYAMAGYWLVGKKRAGRLLDGEIHNG